MALVLADRVQQTGTANTTVSFTLSGTVTGFQSFAVVGNGNTTYYSSFDTSGNWEVGLGTYSTTGPTLTRTTVVSSSNSGSAVTFSGSVNVFLTYPAEYAVWASSAPTTSGYILTSNGTGVAPSWQQGGAGTITVTDFTATSGQTVFTVSYTVGLVSVYRNGIKLGNADYTATNGTSITLATGAVTGDLIEVVAFSSLNLYSTITYQDFNGDGTTTIFTMNAVPANAASLLVAISGVVQDPSTYTVVGTTLTFSAAPPSGTNNVSVRYLGIPSVGSVSSFSAGTTGLTPAPNTTGAVTLAGTLAVANGGTGVTTSTGSGSVVLSTSPSFTTPVLGTPTSGNFSTGTFTWPTFNQNTSGSAGSVANALTISSPLTGTSYNGSSAVSVGIPAATASVNGYLTSTDWNTFNGKQAAGSYVTVGGALGTPSSGTLTNCTFPTLNQNTSGTAAGLSSTLAVGSGGTGVTTSTGSGSTVLSTSPTITTPIIDKINTSVANTSIGAGNASIMKNRIINGAMVISQRNGTSSVTPANGDYTLDRWCFGLSQASKLTCQQNAGSVTPPVGFNNYLGITSSSAYSILSGDVFRLQQYIEGFNFADLNWGTANAKTVTLSFQVYSSLTGTFGGALTNDGGTRSYPFTYTISSANTWTSISVTIAGDTSGTWVGATNGIGLRVRLSLGAGATSSGTAGAWASADYSSATGATSVVGTSGATFYITGVQLEVGSSATGFEYRQYGQELALCQRYYEVTGLLLASSGVGSTIYPCGYFKVTKRATPTLAITLINGGSGATPAVGAVPNDVSLFYQGANNSTPSNSTWTASAEL